MKWSASKAEKSEEAAVVAELLLVEGRDFFKEPGAPLGGFSEGDKVA
jgi:hypothetical protein